MGIIYSSTTTLGYNKRTIDTRAAAVPDYHKLHCITYSPTIFAFHVQTMNEQSIKIHWDFAHTRVLLCTSEWVSQIPHSNCLSSWYRCWYMKCGGMAPCSVIVHRTGLTRSSTTHCITIITMITSVSPKWVPSPAADKWNPAKPTQEQNQ